MCLSPYFAFSLTRTLSRSFQSVTAKNRKEVLALLSCNRKEVLAVSRTQAQATRNQSQKELLLADAKSSCACIIFGLYCNKKLVSLFNGKLTTQIKLLWVALVGLVCFQNLSV